MTFAKREAVSKAESIVRGASESRRFAAFRVV